MSLIESAKIIRKELLVKDEPVKALNLLRELNIPELKEYEDRTYGLIRHLYEPDIYNKVYGSSGEFKVHDAEHIEPEKYCTRAGSLYPRYGWVIEDIKKDKPATYMDLACYLGSLVITAASLGVESYGVDLTKDAIDIAESRARNAGVSEKTTFYLDNIETFNRVKVDMLSAFEVLEHVTDPEKFIEHLCELSSGWIYITTPNGSIDGGTGNLGHWDWDGNEVHTRGHVRAFTRSSLFKLLDRCNCEIAYLDVVGLLIWAKFRKKNDKKNTDK